MRERAGVTLASLTTLRVGGPAERVIEASTRDELVDVVRGAGGAGGARGAGGEGGNGLTGLLILGGGSNLLVSDDGVRVPVVAVRTTGVRVDHQGDEVLVDVEAGESWDELVARCVSEGWSGVEALAGIPGSVGATPIQNVGAYGQEISDVVVSVDVFDRRFERARTMAPTECGFGYRTSVFKGEPNRYVVLSIRLRLSASADSGPVRYSELASLVGVNLGATAPLGDVHAAVLELRRSKGMLLDSSDQDTWSAGSFFTNPILALPDVPVDAPQWTQPDGRVKTSAAWLIERSGFPRGFGADLGTGAAALSTKHALAITNRGTASARDILLLASTVRDGVHDRFGITLQAEPTLVGINF